jgi:cbb3-type cytochrome oxidase subunit 1
VATGTVFYLLVSIQGAAQAQMAINQTVHFTDWVVGHSHLAMLGFATFAGAGGLVHMWERLPGVRFNRRACEWSYWLLVIGVMIMVVDLTMAGLVEAQTWQSGAPWIESVRAARFYWVIRAHSAVPIAGGFIALLIGITTGPRRQLTMDRDDAVDLRGAERLRPRAASATVEPA